MDEDSIRCSQLLVFLTGITGIINSTCKASNVTLLFYRSIHNNRHILYHRRLYKYTVFLTSWVCRRSIWCSISGERLLRYISSGLLSLPPLSDSNYGAAPSIHQAQTSTVRITWKPEYARPPHLYWCPPILQKLWGTEGAALSHLTSSHCHINQCQNAPNLTNLSLKIKKKFLGRGTEPPSQSSHLSNYSSLALLQNINGRLSSVVLYWCSLLQKQN